MKFQIKNKIYIPVIASMIFSCASVPINTNTSDSNIAQNNETNSPSNLYKQYISDTKLTILSSPKETTKGKTFASPYVIKAEDSDGNPVESFEISVIYPSSRKDGKIEFSEAVITSDLEGKATFTPSAPEFSFNSEVQFFPKFTSENDTSDSEKEKISEIAHENTVKAPFKVQTNLKKSGGIIAVVDFNQNGKAVTSNPVSSSKLLMTLMRLGFTGIGNAPQEITDAVIRDDVARLYARGKSIAPNFLIYGTVKILSIEKVESGVVYNLSAEVKNLSMKTGEITFTTQKTISITEKNDWAALDKARTTLAESIADEIKYGI